MCYILQFLFPTMDGESATELTIKIMEMLKMMNHGSRYLRNYTRVWIIQPGLCDTRCPSQFLHTLYICGEEVQERKVLISIHTAICSLRMRGKL